MGVEIRLNLYETLFRIAQIQAQALVLALFDEPTSLIADQFKLVGREQRQYRPQGLRRFAQQGGDQFGGVDGRILA